MKILIILKIILIELIQNQKRKYQMMKKNSKIKNEINESKRLILINSESKQRKELEKKTEESIKRICNDNKKNILPAKFNNEEMNEIVERLNNLEKEIKNNNKN